MNNDPGSEQRVPDLQMRCNLSGLRSPTIAALGEAKTMIRIPCGTRTFSFSLGDLARRANSLNYDSVYSFSATEAFWIVENDSVPSPTVNLIVAPPFPAIASIAVSVNVVLRFGLRVPKPSSI
jgi:hypothetical protein